MAAASKTNPANAPATIPMMGPAPGPSLVLLGLAVAEAIVDGDWVMTCVEVASEFASVTDVADVGKGVSDDFVRDEELEVSGFVADEESPSDLVADVRESVRPVEVSDELLLLEVGMVSISGREVVVCLSELVDD